MHFEEAYKLWLEHHQELRTGERKGRLIRGHNHAEKLLVKNIWWPLFGNLDNLHPEYEVYDWNRKSQFLDLAFLPGYIDLGIECDGFQTHVRDMDRDGFSYSLNRDAYLMGMGWRVIHFSYDDVLNRPEICRMLLQLVLSPSIALQSQENVATLVAEKEVLRLAWKLGGVVRPLDVEKHMRINFRTARRHIQSLAAKGLIDPIPGNNGVRYYEVRKDSLRSLL
ncbi:hypothetical protein [Gorillibacterium massiliense]|uniref:hypothetical protein n=1 Tax=Gorillibacterium massiliense TaxID=1280390 RepID=UPI0004B0110D|nr:hypothetical protein [Gorillibacterium massiliense]